MLMSANEERRAAIDWRAADRVQTLMADRGWTPRDIETKSKRTGNPSRQVSFASVYRVVSKGHKPRNPVQYEIAAVFGLLPSHIWGDAPMPTASVAVDAREMVGAR